MQTNEQKCKTIGFWLPEKKVQKLNMQEFGNVCKKAGYDLVKLNLNQPLEDQGPFCVIFHKLMSIIIDANGGDKKSQETMAALDRYFVAHPELPVIDSIDRLKRISDRYRCYLALKNQPQLSANRVFIPCSVELTSSDPAVNLNTLRTAGVKFPFVCKPSVSHGTIAHEMSIIFNEDGVADCKPPAVAQTFINHNAVVYKIYCVGNDYKIVNRPSIKNFYEFSGQKTIFFSSNVSKPDATSRLCVLDDNDPSKDKITGPLDSDRIKRIVDAVRAEIGLKFLGIDVIIENETDRYAIIDINSYPSYDGFPNFFDSLMSCLLETIAKPSEVRKNSTSPMKEGKTGRLEQEDSGFDTSDSSHSQ